MAPKTRFHSPRIFCLPRAIAPVDRFGLHNAEQIECVQFVYSIGRPRPQPSTATERQQQQQQQQQEQQQQKRRQRPTSSIPHDESDVTFRRFDRSSDCSARAGQFRAKVRASVTRSGMQIRAMASSLLTCEPLLLRRGLA